VGVGMGVRAVFIDVGGTLYEEKRINPPPWTHALALIIEQVSGRSVEPSDVLRIFLDVREELYEDELREVWNLTVISRMLSRLGITPSPSLIEEAYTVFINSIKNYMRPRPGAKRVLAAIKSMGLKLGVISNTGSHSMIVDVLKRDGLLGLLDAVVTSQLVGWRKPSPRIFLFAAEILGVEPRHCIHVGDDPTADVGGAKAAGFIAVQYVREGYQPSTRADAHIRSLEELVPLIKSYADG